MTQFGKYELHEQLGKGGFGTVYRATDHIGRTVAIKVLKPGYMDDPDVLLRFKQEALAAGSLFHPHIATILDLEEADGRVFVVMRFIEGKSLDVILRERKKLPMEEAVTIISQVGEALQFAHEKGFIHRDVKPANIIISPSEGAVLTDFGLVKAATSSGVSTTNVMMGTPAYIAPEIWSGKKATPATDIYSLACVFYEMLTGKVLFDGDSTPEIMKKHFDDLEINSDFLVEIPQWLREILSRALSKNENLRFLSIKEFLESLRSEIVLPIDKRTAKEKTIETDSTSVTWPSSFEHEPQDRLFDEKKPDPSGSGKNGDQTSTNARKLDNQNKANKKPLVIILLVFCGIAAVIITSINGTNQRQEEMRLSTQQAFTERERNIEATNQAINSEVTSLKGDAVLIYGPKNGSLQHEENSYSCTTSYQEGLSDFIITAKFTNPYDSTENGWDYGFLFSQHGSSKHYWIIVSSDNYWQVVLRDYSNEENKFETIDSGSIQSLNTNANESNTVSWIGNYSQGYLLVNDQLISTFELPDVTIPGDVSICTGFFNGNKVVGKVTNFENWEIWNLDVSAVISHEIDRSYQTFMDLSPVESIYTGNDGTLGITNDGNDFLLIKRTDENGLMHRIDRYGNKISQFTLSGHFVDGITFDGEDIWYVETNDSHVFRIDPDTGTSLQSFWTPGWGNINDITWDGNYLWMASSQPYRIYKIDPVTGNEVLSLDGPIPPGYKGEIPDYYGENLTSLNISGLTWDGEYLWVGEMNTETIMQIDPTTGDIHKYFNVGSTIGTPCGLTWWDGSLWITAFSSYIYRFQP